MSTKASDLQPVDATEPGNGPLEIMSPKASFTV